MSEARVSFAPSRRDDRRRSGAALLCLALGVAILAPASRAIGAPAQSPSVAAGFTISKLAAAPLGATNCDDLARLDGHLFMTCQNATLSTGGGGNSTIVEYADDGSVLNTWSIPDKADGIGGDPLHHRVIVTLNEDAKSHLVTITPSAPTGQQITNYNYSPGAPETAAAKGALHTGGGTDAVNLDSSGHVFLTASYGIGKAGTAVFKAVLTPPASPGGTGTAALTPTFLDNATATNGNTGTGTVTLKLIDVDSGAIVPYTSPLHGGSFVIDDQTSQQLVFADDINAGHGLTALHTPYGLDDIRWTTSDGGTLYIVDKGAAPNGLSALYKVTGPFVAGQALASNDSIGDQVVNVNVADGTLKPFVRHLQTTKGLVYVDPTGAEPALALAPLTSPAAAAVAAPAAAVSRLSADDDTLTTVLVIVMLAVLVGGGGFVIRRGRPGTT